MRIIVAGGRDLHPDLALYILDQLKETEGHPVQLMHQLVSGCAHGIDEGGASWARTYKIPVVEFPADWSKGKSAGPIRNAEMADYADHLVVIWDGKSKGSKNMLSTMLHRGKSVTEIIIGFDEQGEITGWDRYEHPVNKPKKKKEWVVR